LHLAAGRWGSANELLEVGDLIGDWNDEAARLIDSIDGLQESDFAEAKDFILKVQLVDGLDDFWGAFMLSNQLSDLLESIDLGLVLGEWSIQQTACELTKIESTLGGGSWGGWVQELVQFRLQLCDHWRCSADTLFDELINFSFQVSNDWTSGGDATLDQSINIGVQLVQDWSCISYAFLDKLIKVGFPLAEDWRHISSDLQCSIFQVGPLGLQVT